MKRIWALTAIIGLILFSTSTATAQDARVFENASDFSGPLDTEVARITGLLEEGGFQVIASRDASVPGECSYDATVISVYDAAFSDAAFALNADTAPYGIVNRVVVFQDEDGGHVAYANPNSILRTVFVDDSAANGATETHRAKLRDALQATAVTGYGQERGRGHIGKTMGVMAGGPFDTKLGIFSNVVNARWDEVASSLEAAFNDASGSWNLEIAYRLDVADQDVAVFGITGARMESKSFSIVGAGSSKARKQFACPGIAYAASYPLEVVVRQSDNDVNIEMVDAMFRMKMYFEDAGKWAFMKNMTMPGSLAGEIKDRVAFALK